jgi:hypothetical protein
MVRLDLGAGPTGGPWSELHTRPVTDRRALSDSRHRELLAGSGAWAGARHQQVLLPFLVTPRWMTRLTRGSAR